jgi:hypothetical protein
MSVKSSVKAETASKVIVEEAKVGPGYRRPEVHDLGKLELVRGAIGIVDDNRPSNWHFLAF